ncbi:S8 family serine peptidase [Dactylosporangium matsuzakiense]|uniref:Serine protease n=1 Tax=Dactylosporangium matsuzakiense TaxID=53360 RepID=A0A9W6KUT8_9ACTN|nr:S8 family serine peptidase [Dactylosporangium matsuzakiense]UWZ43766.1 S8 family serine peptidase [Dactylosporangium matsuzakiense]GLL06815.1 serine protease [Dactylosporangium matsuzakiense]
MTKNIARRAITGIVLGTAATAATAFSFGAAAFAAPAQGTIQNVDAPGALKDQYIVVMKDGSTTTSDALAGKVGGKIEDRFDSAVRGFSGHMSADAARRLAADPAVSYVEQDRRVQIESTETSPTWGLDRIDQAALPLDKSYTYGPASNVTAYIIDTGVRMTHSEYAGRVKSGYDFVDNDADATDCQGHGTHVAGTVGGKTYGVAKDVKMVAVRVLDCSGGGSYSQIIAGVDWVTKNAVKPAVANMSLGGAAGATMDNAVKKSIASGVTYAVAGGNDSAAACTKSPARLPEAITVGATDATDTRASFSNYGSCLDIFAPGVNITSSSNASNTGTQKMSGTSMATPEVTGAAALYLAGHPTATPAQVRDALVAAATNGVVKSAGNGSPNKLLNTTSFNNAAPATPVTDPAPPTTPVTNPANPGTPAACTAAVSTTAVAIPDPGTAAGKVTVANCAGTGSKTATVKVSIKHADRGDLRIDLVSPDGTSYHLKSAISGDDVAFGTATYTVDLSTEVRNGTWTLLAKDVFAGDAGTLTGWTLNV